MLTWRVSKKLSRFLSFDIVFLFDTFVDLGMTIKSEYFSLYFSILTILLFDVYFRLSLDFRIRLIPEMIALLQLYKN